MTWKYEKLANDTKKPLGSISGYEAMVISLKERKKDHIILVFMPPPKADDITWDAGDGDYVEKPYDHAEEVGFTQDPKDLSAKTQLAAIKSGSSSHLQHLTEHYPVGNVGQFPSSCTLLCMVGGKPHYWELTQLCLEVWANSLARGKEGVTIENLLNLPHFDASACMKMKTGTMEALLPQADASTTITAPVQNAPPPPPPPAMAHLQALQPPAYPPPYNMPLPPHWMYGPNPLMGAYMYPPPMPPYAQFPYGHQGGPFPLGPSRDSPASSPGTTLQLRIPLVDFCSRYDISHSDQDKLAKLGYRPGNNIVLSLTPEEWEKAEFTSLDWRSVIAAHKHFLRDAKEGMWHGV